MRSWLIEGHIWFAIALALAVVILAYVAAVELEFKTIESGRVRF